MRIRNDVYVSCFYSNCCRLLVPIGGWFVRCLLFDFLGFLANLFFCVAWFVPTGKPFNFLEGDELFNECLVPPNSPPWFWYLRVMWIRRVVYAFLFIAPNVFDFEFWCMTCSVYAAWLLVYSDKPDILSCMVLMNWKAIFILKRGGFLDVCPEPRFSTPRGILVRRESEKTFMNFCSCSTCFQHSTLMGGLFVHVCHLTPWVS